MRLQHNLLESQVNAATKLHEMLDGWKTTDLALERLATKFPGTDLESCLLKTVSVNSLYSTRVLAVWRMAVHVHQALSQTDIDSAGPGLVEEIASLPKSDGPGVERRFRSFASKFSHFFIDPEEFPILDSRAETIITYHLGRVRAMNNTYPYIAFHENFFTLKKAANIADRPNRDLDRYLWLAGQYRQWLKNPETTIGREVRALFEDASDSTKRLLKQLYPIGKSGT